jgi:hypothetical protein
MRACAARSIKQVGFIGLPPIVDDFQMSFPIKTSKIMMWFPPVFKT